METRRSPALRPEPRVSQGWQYLDVLRPLYLSCLMSSHATLIIPLLFLGNSLINVRLPSFFSPNQHRAESATGGQYLCYAQLLSQTFQGFSWSVLMLLIAIMEENKTKIKFDNAVAKNRNHTYNPRM